MIIWEKIKKGQYRTVTKKYIFCITENGRKYWVADIFDVKIKDINKAYIDSVSYDSLREAEKDLEEWV